MDVTDRSSTFLKYCDTNYINALDPTQMNADTVRMALLGALRYGKPIVFDMMELDRYGEGGREGERERKRERER